MTRQAGLWIMLAAGATALFASSHLATAAGHVDLAVVIVSASGSGGKAEFDPRIPRDVQSKLVRLRLSYSKYAFIGSPRQATPLGAVASFGLPANEALTIRPSAQSPEARLLRLDTRILDARRRAILTSQVRAGYGRVFFLHRPKGATGILLGITAHRGR